MLTGIHRHLNIFVFWKSKSKITKLTCVSPSTEMRNAYAINMASESWRNQRSILPTCQCVCVAGARSGERLGGSGPRGQSPPVTPAPKWTRLCRPWSSALLWGGRIFQERQALKPQWNHVSLKQSEGRGRDPKFRLLAPPCLKLEPCHLSPSLFVSYAFLQVSWRSHPP